MFYGYSGMFWFVPCTIGLTSFILYRNNEDSFVDNLMLGVQLADVSTRCSSHPQGKSEARCEIDGNFFIGVAPELARACGPVQRSKH